MLNNWRKHNEDRGRTAPLDAFSSAISFRDWKDGAYRCPPDHEPLPVKDPQSWLLRVGWKKRHAPISCFEVPGPREQVSSNV